MLKELWLISQWQSSWSIVQQQQWWVTLSCICFFNLVQILLSVVSSYLHVTLADVCNKIMKYRNYSCMLPFDRIDNWHNHLNVLEVDIAVTDCSGELFQKNTNKNTNNNIKFKVNHLWWEPIETTVFIGWYYWQYYNVQWVVVELVLLDNLYMCKLTSRHDKSHW